MGMRNEYVGTYAASSAIDRPAYWVREMVALGLVRDNRVEPGKGRRLAFGLFEFYQLTALSACRKHMHFRHISLDKMWQEFEEALAAYVYNPTAESEYDLVFTREGFRAGWDFSRLESVACSNYAMALRVHETLSPASQRHCMHASV